MKKLKYVLLFVICMMIFGTVNAESLNVKLAQEKDGEMVFNVTAADIKDQKINIVAGTLNIDSTIFKNIEIIGENGWEIYVKQDGKDMKFVLLNVSNYLVENATIANIKTNITKDNTINEELLNIGNIESSSMTSVIKIKDVVYKLEKQNIEQDNNKEESIPKEENNKEETKEEIKEETESEKEEDKPEVPKEEVSNKIEEDNNKDEQEETNEEKKETTENKKNYSYIFIIILILIILIIFVLITNNKKTASENKKGGK